MIVNMGFVDMGTDDIGVIALQLSEALGQPLQPKRFCVLGVISLGTKDCCRR